MADELVDPRAHVIKARRALRSRDTELMAAALTTLGSHVDTGSEHWQVTPGPLRAGVVDCGLAGTVMRFVPPVAALADGPVTFDGDPHARTRPMSGVIDALRGLGVEVEKIHGSLDRELSERDIEWYVGEGEWRGRAGGYAVQGRGAALVTAIAGDYTNVVGLPVAVLVDAFAEAAAPADC